MVGQWHMYHDQSSQIYKGKHHGSVHTENELKGFYQVINTIVYKNLIIQLYLVAQLISLKHRIIQKLSEKAHKISFWKIIDSSYNINVIE